MSETVSIPLPGGRVALIDAEDAHLVNLLPRWTWDGRYVRRLLGKGGPVEYLHRRVVGLEAGDRRHTDHINGDTLDNRAANLRAVSCAVNLANRRGPNANNTSGYRGVTWSGRSRKWIAQSEREGRHIHLGSFTEREHAAAAVRAYWEGV